jgi:hypothetical protein
MRHYNHAQAYIFDKTMFTIRQVNQFLQRNNIEKLKPIHTTMRYYRVRVAQPDYKHYFYKTITISKGIKMIYAYPL